MSGFFASLELNDLAETLRRRGRYPEALATVERGLKKNPANPRGLLIEGRILYQMGMMEQALAALRQLDSRVPESQELHWLTRGLEDLRRGPNPKADTFATETMAKLQIRQGYLWEAMEIYRQLYLSTPQQPLWTKILDLRKRLQESPGESQDSVERFQALDQWIENEERSH